MEAQDRRKQPMVDTTSISSAEWQVLAETIVSAIERFYDDPENVARFNLWKNRKKRKGETP